MNRGIIGIVAAIIIIVIIAAGSWYTVDQTERGVRLRYGAVVGTAQPGLGFKIPLIDSVEKISVKTSTFAWDKMNSYSYDQQPAEPKISVTQANAKANAVRAEAQASADALRLNGEARATNIKLTGEAEAAAIEARAKALGTNPNLVTLVQAERWNGVLPTTMVPGSAVPFVSVK